MGARSWFRYTQQKHVKLPGTGRLAMSTGRPQRAMARPIELQPKRSFSPSGASLQKGRRSDRSLASDGGFAPMEVSLQ